MTKERNESKDVGLEAGVRAAGNPLHPISASSNIMVIDNDPLQAHLFERILADDGYHITLQRSIHTIHNNFIGNTLYFHTAGPTVKGSGYRYFNPIVISHRIIRPAGGRRLFNPQVVSYFFNGGIFGFEGFNIQYDYI